MKPGDKVRYRDAAGGGVVASVDGDGRVVVVDDNGFEIPAMVSQLVVVDEAGDELMRTLKVRRKSEQQVAHRVGHIRGGAKNVRSVGGNQPSLSPSATAAGSFARIEVDLHSTALGIASFPAELQRELQMERFRAEMKAHARQKGLKLVFIHGQGEGVLRESIRQEISKHYPNCTVEDASFAQYGFRGATEIHVV